MFSDKLHINFQKINRQEFIKKLPLQVVKIIESAEYILYPDSEKIFNRWLYGSKEGLGETKQKPKFFTYRNVSWPEEVLKIVKDIQIDDGCAGYYYNFFTSNQPSSLNSKNPIYKVKFGFLRENFEVLWNICLENFSFSAEDFSKGILIDYYIGYLENDPNPDEVIYQIITWGVN
jgi:hypothetical protein